jgi:hypothetical protein
MVTGKWLNGDWGGEKINQKYEDIRLRRGFGGQAPTRKKLATDLFCISYIVYRCLRFLGHNAHSPFD